MRSSRRGSKRDSGRKLTTHHIYPKCRFSSKETVEIPAYFHQCWHGIFGELSPEESRLFLERLVALFKRGGVLRYNFLVKLRDEAKQP